MSENGFEPEVIVIGPMGGRVRIEISVLPAGYIQSEESGEIIEAKAELLSVSPVATDEIGVERIDDDPTPRELDVLRFIAQGYTNRQIAETLKISIRTVESHRANLMVKWNKKSRKDLIKEAKARGLINNGPN